VFCWFDIGKNVFRCGFCVVHERAVASTGFLAQTSLSRLGEISRGSPRTWCSIFRL